MKNVLQILFFLLLLIPETKAGVFKTHTNEPVYKILVIHSYTEELVTYSKFSNLIGEKLEDGEPFETETDVLERFRDCGYPAATLKELELMFDADELIIFEFTNPYLDLEQKNACA